MRKSRRGELRFFQMAAELSTPFFSSVRAESKPDVAGNALPSRQRRNRPPSAVGQKNLRGQFLKL
jgi:hypothetical protein